MQKQVDAAHVRPVSDELEKWRLYAFWSFIHCAKGSAPFKQQDNEQKRDGEDDDDDDDETMTMTMAARHRKMKAIT